MGSSIVTFSNITFTTIIEISLAVKFWTGNLENKWPEYIPTLTGLIIYIFVANYAFLALYSEFYRRWLSPLRNLPRAKWSWVYILWRRFVKGSMQGQVFLEMIQGVPNDGLVAFGDNLLVTKPSALADLLVIHCYDFTKPEGTRKFLRHLIGEEGVIALEGQPHKILRNILHPTFSYRRVKDLYPIMWNRSVKLVELVEAEIQAQNSGGDGHGLAGSIEISLWTYKIALDIIGFAILGRNLGVLEEKQNQLINDYEDLWRGTPEKNLYFFLSAWLSFEMVQLLPWKMNKFFIEKTSSMKRRCDRLVQQKREEMKEREHFDILALLIKSGKLSDRQMSDQLVTSMAAGHDTTAPAISWTCYLLSKHLNWQDALRKEVSEALNVAGDESNLDARLEQLPILNAVISETIRLYPTIPDSPRVAIKDTTIMGQPVPSGTHVLIPIWLVNRSPDVWGPDAQEFKPERWIEKGKRNNTGGARSNYDFMTFSHGPRNCIGQFVARAEMRCVIAALVRRFEWTLDMDDKDVIPSGALTIRPGNGLYLRMKIVEG
ncbi:cytochrome P450 [Biscogniauxia mediterranea]|nr:cytochrome P450 [Biscogniauxia mediterranea]